MGIGELLITEGGLSYPLMLLILMPFALSALFLRLWEKLNKVYDFSALLGGFALYLIALWLWVTMKEESQLFFHLVDFRS